MKKSISILFLLFSHLIYSQSNDTELVLKYSVLHRADNEKFKLVESGSNVFDNDNLRINVQFQKLLSCYVIYKDPEDNIAIFYNSADSTALSIQDSTLSKDLTFGTSGTKTFYPPLGDETIYLLLSRSRLDKLEKIITDLNRSSGARAKKFSKRFLSEIEKLSLSKPKEENIASRLEKPIVGGVSFRGDDDEINLYSLTHEARDENVIVEVITLKHIDLKNK